ncbi:MAG: 5'/3'-nucleotidase SurE [Saprospiraceae bacterium]|nr:5'/3'-nucleotidase SurE [Bacteroidia bacterium]NNE16301.1 5'/3'-nucleotidase SurE [Saprospiraceae bacterium]
MGRPRILVTNDDGINAPGIRALVDVVKQFGDPIVVAPDSPQSGQGHAITITKPLFLKKVDVFDNIEAYECSGTPADCVKLAKNVILKDSNIDLCVSGINHGSNASINIIYSGTMSAAMEASLEGIKSIGFSLLDFSFEADFTAAKHYASQIVESMLSYNAKKNILLNVNIPKLPLNEIKGIKVCAQGEGVWTEDFKESEDPRGQKYYWLTGSFKSELDDTNTDLWALSNGYVSVVPSKHDLTDYDSMEGIKTFERS